VTETRPPDSPLGGSLHLLGDVRKGNVFEETLERLLRGIRLGVFPLGQRMPAERELAEALGVSRATLRDALAALQEAGYVSIQRGRYGGAVVATELPGAAESLEQADAAWVEDVLLFRSVVEPAAAAQAAGAALTARQRQALNEALEALGHADVGEYRPLDARLHVLIGEATGSTMLARAVAEARSATSDLLDRIPFLDINLAHSQDQHEQIVAAILAGEVEQARARMAEHLEGTAALLRGFLQGEG